MSRWFYAISKMGKLDYLRPDMTEPGEALHVLVIFFFFFFFGCILKTELGENK